MAHTPVDSADYVDEETEKLAQVLKKLGGSMQDIMLFNDHTNFSGEARSRRLVREKKEEAKESLDNAIDESLLVKPKGKKFTRRLPESANKQLHVDRQAKKLLQHIEEQDNRGVEEYKIPEAVVVEIPDAGSEHSGGEFKFPTPPNSLPLCGNGPSPSYKLPFEMLAAGKREERLTQLRRAGQYPAPFELLKMNKYVSRPPTSLDEDAIHVCRCKYVEGEVACGESCINRAVHEECVYGFCPCGVHCANQRFQAREYVRIAPFKTEKKGYGLKALEPVKTGQFIIEYVGELIDDQMLQERTDERGEDVNIYFMMLNSTDVIDASRMGNLARFMNHSCQPNCETQKWYIGGEIRVGMFATQDIDKDEELTFDYQYVRFGAKKTVCHCGMPKCRGYIGEKVQKKDKNSTPSTKRKRANVKTPKPKKEPAVKKEIKSPKIEVVPTTEKVAIPNPCSGDVVSWENDKLYDSVCRSLESGAAASCAAIASDGAKARDKKRRKKGTQAKRHRPLLLRNVRRGMDSFRSIVEPSDLSSHV